MDENGLLVHIPNYLVCLNNNGTVRWAKAGVPHSEALPPKVGPDGSILITLPVPSNPNQPAGATYLIKFLADGSLAWTWSIDGFMPVTDRFIQGRNPQYDGENIWLAGGTGIRFPALPSFNAMDAGIYFRLKTLH